MIYDPFYFYYFLYFDNPLNFFFNDFYLWYFLDHFNNFFYNYRNFNNFFNDVFNRYYFLNCICIYFRHLKFNITNLFNFFDHWIINNFLHYFLNNFNFRNFDYSFNNLFDDFFNLNYFRHTSKHLQDIINRNNTHDFLSDHADDSFIDFQSNSSFIFQLF